MRLTSYRNFLPLILLVTTSLQADCIAHLLQGRRLRTNWWHQRGEALVGKALADKFGMGRGTPRREADEAHWRAYLQRYIDNPKLRVEDAVQAELPLSDLFQHGVATVAMPKSHPIAEEEFRSYLAQKIEEALPKLHPRVGSLNLREESAAPWGTGVHIDQFIYQPGSGCSGLADAAYYPAYGCTLRSTWITPSSLYGQTLAIPYAGPYEGKLVQAPDGFFLVFLAERVLHTSYPSPAIPDHPRQLWISSTSFFFNPEK